MNIIIKRIKKSAYDMPPNYTYQMSYNQPSVNSIVNDVLNNQNKFTTSVDLHNHKLLMDLVEHKPTILNNIMNKAQHLWNKITTIGKEDTTFYIEATIKNAVINNEEFEQAEQALIEQLDNVLGETDAQIRFTKSKNSEGLLNINYTVSGSCSSKIDKDTIKQILSFNNIAEIHDFKTSIIEEKKIEKSDEKNVNEKEEVKQEKDITTPDMSTEQKIENIAKYISSKTGIDYKFIMAQKIHEIGYKGSPLSNVYHNWGGLKAEGKSYTDEKGHTYFESDKDYADTWIEQIATKYSGLTQASTIEEYLEIMRHNEYFEANPEEYCKDVINIYHELS